MEIPKFFKTKRNIKLVIGALVAANTIATFIPVPSARETSQSFYSFDEIVTADITLEEMKNMIYSSTKLTEEEKEFLYNEALFEDVLPYINQSERMKKLYRLKFDNLDVKSYGDFIKKMYHASGLYFSNSSSNLYVAYYEGIGIDEDDTLAHEYMHATQDVDAYSFFIEPAAEIAAHEYYGAPIEDYKEEVKLLKLLMETIGSEPIKQYVYTGDFSLIEERVRPNLSDEEYAEFLECIKESVHIDNKLRNHRLNAILRSLYLNIYGEPMSHDEIIGEIKSGNRSLHRYYFNNRNEEYYMEGEVVYSDDSFWPTIVPIRHDIESIELRESMFYHKNKGDNGKGF